MEPIQNEQDQTFIYAKASDLIRIMRTPTDRANLAKELSIINYIISRFIFSK